MMPVANRPVLHHLLNLLRRHDVTDVGRDGMLEGPDIPGAQVLQRQGARVIVSGERAAELAHVGVGTVVLGARDVAAAGDEDAVQKLARANQSIRGPVRVPVQSHSEQQAAEHEDGQQAIAAELPSEQR